MVQVTKVVPPGDFIQTDCPTAEQSCGVHVVGTFIILESIQSSPLNPDHSGRHSSWTMTILPE